MRRANLAGLLVAMVMAVAACGKSASKEAPATPAPVAAAPAVAPASAPAPAPAAAKPAEPLWPETLPPGWKMFDDYEGTDPKRDGWGGAVGTWGFRTGQCKVEFVKDGASQRQKLTYSFPMGDSQCGTSEYFKGEKGKPKPFDISAYDRVVFLMKSGDGAAHKVHFEITELDPYDAALQGYTGEQLFTAPPDWQRFEVNLDKVLHPNFDRKKGRQVGLRIDRKEQEQASGVVLIDNIAFIEKGK